MKRSIFITAVAGTGKSSVSAELTKLGYRSYDIEDEPGLFTMVHKQTREPFTDFSNNDADSVEQSDWICNKKRLEKLISEQNSSPTFYCGVASNNDEIWELFTDHIVLRVSKETLISRLQARKDEEFGNTQEVQELVLGWKDWFERHCQDKGAVLIEAERDALAVVKSLLSTLNIS